MTRHRLSEAEQDLLSAIDRIAVGKPQNKLNRQLQRTGRLRLTPTTVAREAKRSRQSIYRSERIRDALAVSQKLHASDGSKMRAMVDEAREDRRSIAEENQLLISNLAKARIAALDLMQELKELQSRFERRGTRIKELEHLLEAVREENQLLKTQIKTLQANQNAN